MAGNGPLAEVLGQVLSGDVIGIEALDMEPLQAEEEGGGYPLLKELHSVMMVVPMSAGLTDVARWVDQIWRLVGRFSSAGDQHDLRWVFVPVASESGRIEEGLGAFLAVPSEAQLTSLGYGIWCPQYSLEELGRVWRSIHPKDLLALRARQNRDGRRRALSTLLGTLQGDDPDAVVAAANEVATQFPDKEDFLLDVFCRPPDHHLNGGKLRRWLAEVVTRGVTPHLCSSSRSEVEGWLLSELAPPP